MDRRTTSAVTLGVLVMLCVFGLLFGVSALTQDLPDEPLVDDPPASCEPLTVRAGSKLRSTDVTVSVYNAGQTNGLAGETMSKFIERGFARGSSGNAPKGTDVKYAQIWAEDPKNPAVQLVKRQIGLKIKVVPDKEKLGIGVLVVVGDDFKQLRKAKQSIKVKKDAEICSPPVS